SVVTAERYADQRFAFNSSVLLTEHVPAVASVTGRELRVAGVLLLAAGLLCALWSRNTDAIFVTAGAAGMLAMVVNLSGDLKGFITPVMVLVWPLAGLGVGVVRRALESIRVHPRIAAAISIVAAASMPVSNLAANYAEADQRDTTGPGRFLRSVYRQLPERAGVVAEDYFYDMAAHYFWLTGEGGGGRSITRVRFDAAAVRDAARGTGSIDGGRRIFAFAGAATFLGAEGLHFDRAMVVGPSLDEWLKDLPNGSVIVGAAAYVPVPSEFSNLARRLGRARSFTAFALLTGRSGAVWREGDSPIALALEPGVLASAPAFGGAVRASADERHARIEVAGRTIAQVDAGLALAVFSKNGALLRAIEFPPGESLRVPFEEALYELKAEAPCVDVTTGDWSDVTPALSTGSWLTTMPTFGSVTMETAIGGGIGSGTRSSVLVGDGSVRTVPLEAFRTDGSAQSVPHEGFGAKGSAQSVPHDELLLTELTRNGERRPVFRLALDRVPVGARARLRAGGAQSHIAVCAHEPHSLFAAGRDQATLRPDFESEAYFGAGWSDAERIVTGPVRRARGHATLLLPFDTGYRYHASFDVVADAAARVNVTVNGIAAGACDLHENSPCEVDLLPAMLRQGVNPLALTTGGSEPSGQGSVLTFRGGRLRRTPVR
ncbi:MAG: hypothetical protein LC804_26655, partial [Acidobacteria bacterium]|nr:hypothetical protein [Acidobacteriota bacterium]